MPVPLIRKDYLLSEAFELVGRRLYGNRWTGYEIFQGPIPSPEEFLHAREPYLDAYARIETEIADIHGHLKRTLNESEIRDLQQRLYAAIERQQEAVPEVHSHPEPTDANASFHEAYQRRQKAETTLIDAIRNDTIKVHNGRNNPIDSVLWKGHPHFGYYIELSMVRVPRLYDRRRFQPARIDIVQFDIWVDTLVPLVASPLPTLTPIEQCRIFLKEVIAGGIKHKLKDACRVEALERIQHLSRRKFNSVWDELAPAEWKHPGRRPGT